MKNTMNPSQPNRRFLMSDAIVLVAATGLGLAGCRYWFLLDENEWGHIWDTSVASIPRRLWIGAIRSIPVLSILSFNWTLAILLLRLRGPRPSRRHLWCQPGFLACVAVLFVLAWKGLVLGLCVVSDSLLLSTTPRPQLTFRRLVSEIAQIMLSEQYAPHQDLGYAVLLVWLVTQAAGRCRFEASWIDRTGRCLGLGWVFIALLVVSAWCG